MSELSSTSVVPAESLEPTPLTAHLQTGAPDRPAAPFRGALTLPGFTEESAELAALTAAAGIFDLGYRAFAKVTGADRIRWMNGMVTNTIAALEEGQGNYSFLLNAQGRILGDATIYRFSDHLLLETDRSQIAALLGHLDHFIIMDDVELHLLDASTTAIGVAGPAAAQLLSRLGFEAPKRDFSTAFTWRSAEIILAHAYSPLVPRFSLRLPSEAAPAMWTTLLDAGAVPCGSASVESLRVLEGTPLYGIDIRDRHLAQETGQSRALNFSKGCYLGQEIVERIRSRATIHRTFRQFSLSSPPASLVPGQTLPLQAEGAQQNPAGDLSSVAEYHLPDFTGTLALGFIRTEALERKLPLSVDGVTVTALDAPPRI